MIRPHFSCCLLACFAALSSVCAETWSIQGEPLLFVGETKTTATAKLLVVPKEAPQLTSADGKKVYTAGNDFTWSTGSREMTLTASSSIPFKTTAELYPPANAPQAYKKRKNSEQWMFFGPNGVLHQLQCQASYSTEEASPFPKMAPAPAEQLDGLRQKLKKKEPIKLVTLGDSISTGADASALANLPPMQKGYHDLVADRLQASFGSVVTTTNLSKGGMDSHWGTTRIADVIAEKPDLLLLAFGMNDASGHRSPKDFAQITQQIVEGVRAKLPDCSILLISSMTANSEWQHASPELYPLYAKALAGLVGKGVALADVTTPWSVASDRKKHLDYSGNGLNHPNDAGHRLYADVIIGVIGN